MDDVVISRSDHGVLIRLRWDAARRLHAVLGEVPAIGAEVTIWEELNEHVRAAGELPEERAT